MNTYSNGYYLGFYEKNEKVRYFESSITNNRFYFLEGYSVSEFGSKSSSDILFIMEQCETGSDKFVDFVYGASEFYEESEEKLRSIAELIREYELEK